MTKEVPNGRHTRAPPTNREQSGDSSLGLLKRFETVLVSLSLASVCNARKQSTGESRSSSPNAYLNIANAA